MKPKIKSFVKRTVPVKYHPFLISRVLPVIKSVRSRLTRKHSVSSSNLYDIIKRPEEDLQKIFHDFNQFIHEIRGYYLASMPKNANVLVSAGCAGSWFFDWVAEKYGTVGQHIGVECYSPRPKQLPPNVKWISSPVHICQICMTSLWTCCSVDKTLNIYGPTKF